MINFYNICKELIAFDNSIRFAGVASIDGKILASIYRDGLIPLLTTQESELSIMQSLIRINMRKTLEPKLGKTLFTYGEYQKVKRATFVMYDKQTGEGEAILMVSFDRKADAYSIIEHKIKPLLRNIGKSLEEE